MEYLGIVKEVFIPESIDILKSNKIGFRVYAVSYTHLDYFLMIVFSKEMKVLKVISMKKMVILF